MVLLIENHLRETEVFRGKFFGGRTMIEFQCDYAEYAEKDNPPGISESYRRDNHVLAAD